MAEPFFADLLKCDPRHHFCSLMMLFKQEDIDFCDTCKSPLESQHHCLEIQRMLSLGRYHNIPRLLEKLSSEYQDDRCSHRWLRRSLPKKITKTLCDDHQPGLQNVTKEQIRISLSKVATSSPFTEPRRFEVGSHNRLEIGLDVITICQ